MSIQELPQYTIGLIGASQELTDVAAVVKELVENALDARALSISIELSANTIDIIQVRDNGCGIGPNDRELVCKKACTSKLRHYSDLRMIGQTSLGFRGEALAAAARISGSFTVTTRVDGEEIATSLKIGSGGQIESRERSSYPPGTTVRLTDLFKNLPVRKKRALNKTAKCMTRVKHLLQAYALARPAVRLSLKILQSSGSRLDWIYAPKTGSCIKDTVAKLMGTACAAECDFSGLYSNGYQIHAFLPKRDANLTKCSGLGQFMSVDSRPVSATRNTLKNIVVMCTGVLHERNPVRVKDPFLWMNIICPPGAYDPNIEPTKDDVLFEHPDAITTAVQTLLESFYGPKGQSEKPFSHTAAPSTESTSLLNPVQSPPISPAWSYDESICTYEARSNAHGVQAETTERAPNIEAAQKFVDPWINAGLRPAKSITASHPSLPEASYSQYESSRSRTRDLLTPQASSSPIRIRENDSGSGDSLPPPPSCHSLGQMQRPSRRKQELVKQKIGQLTNTLRRSAGVHVADAPEYTQKYSSSKRPTYTSTLPADTQLKFPLFVSGKENSCRIYQLAPDYVPLGWQSHGRDLFVNSSVDLQGLEDSMHAFGPLCIGTATDENALPTLMEPKPSIDELCVWKARIECYLALSKT